MEKIKTDIKYKTFKIMQMSRGGKLVEIKVPDGVVFHLSMGHVTGVDEDRDTYNFIAVIPYDESIHTFLLEQHILNLLSRRRYQRPNPLLQKLLL